MTVVRTGPDLTRLQRTAPVPSLRRSGRYMAAYLGVMGPQDGVDLVVRMADHVVHQSGATGHQLHPHRIWRLLP